MIRIVTSLVFLLTAFSLGAQVVPTPVMADGFRADGKIWVVVAVIGLVFLAIVGWLVTLERRIGKIEKTINNPGSLK